MPPIFDRPLILRGKLTFCLFCLLGVLTVCSPTPVQGVGGSSVSTLKVVMDNNYPPYVFQDGQGQVQGILIDQWKMWETRTGVKVEITVLPWGEALSRMKAGEFDVIDTIFYTEERAGFFDFTDPYAQIDVRIFFPNNISGLANAQSLRGFRVAVKKGDANIDYLKTQDVTGLVYYDSYEEIVRAAANGTEAIFVIDQPPALYFLYKYGVQDKFKYSEPLYGGAFHRAVRKGNTQILDLVVSGFSRISKSEYQAIDARWFGLGQSNTFQQFIPLIGLGAFVTLLIIFILFTFNRALRSRVKTRTIELQEALSRLQKSETRFREAIEFFPVPISIFDDNGSILSVNRKFIDFYGYSIEDIPSVTEWMLHAYPDLKYRETVLAQWNKDVTDATRDGVSTALMEHKVTCKNGRQCDVEIVMHPVGDLWVAAFDDVTVRKQAEEELRNSESRFRILFEHAGVGVAQIDTQTGQFIRINQRYCDILGYTREELQSMDFQAIVHPDDRQEDMDNRVRLEFGEISEFTMEERCYRKDGTIVWVVLIVSPLWLPEKKTDTSISVIHDITELKQTEYALRYSEAEVRKLNADLEQRVAERTAQLEMANKELEAFSYSVSHDLRAPLRAITGFSHILLDEHASNLDGETQQMLQRVISEAQRMGQLITALLSLSQMSRAEIRNETVNLSSLIQLIIDDLRRSQPQRQVELVVADGLFVQGDVRLLRIMFENLLGNAWKFTSKHEQAIIEFGVDQSEFEPIFFLRDNGAGFNMAYAGKLFGAFQRLHNVDEFEGTGIGLATVQRIVHRHGGRIWAESEVDKGATFYFTFPKRRGIS